MPPNPPIVWSTFTHCDFSFRAYALNLSRYARDLVSILTERKNVFHLSEFSAKSENSNANNPLVISDLFLYYFCSLASAIDRRGKCTINVASMKTGLGDEFKINRFYKQKFEIYFRFRGNTNVKTAFFSPL